VPQPQKKIYVSTNHEKTDVFEEDHGGEKIIRIDSVVVETDTRKVEQM
jgi:hypothetical protein